MAEKYIQFKNLTVSMSKIYDKDDIQVSRWLNQPGFMLMDVSSRDDRHYVVGILSPTYLGGGTSNIIVGPFDSKAAAEKFVLAAHEYRTARAKLVGEYRI